MSTNRDFDRIAGAWLAEGPSELADRVLDAALDEVHLTNQRRRIAVPWRFPPMNTPLRVVAAVAIIAVVGYAGLTFFLPGNGPGSVPSPSPSPTPTLPPGITGWTTYTSAVYGFTMAYPSDWSVYAPATEKWPPDDPVVDEATPWADVFVNPEDLDGDSIGMWVHQMPAPTGADLASWEGLQAVIQEVCDRPGFSYPCESVAEPTPMCFGQQECRPAIIVSVSDERTVSAFFGDPETGVVTVFAMGRQDDFPGAARYGGTVALLKAILAQVDVREPKPGETPH
jgi:hypothetical protein